MRGERDRENIYFIFGGNDSSGCFSRVYCNGKKDMMTLEKRIEPWKATMLCVCVYVRKVIHCLWLERATCQLELWISDDSRGPSDRQPRYSLYFSSTRSGVTCHFCSSFLFFFFSMFSTYYGNAMLFSRFPFPFFRDEFNQSYCCLFYYLSSSSILFFISC